MTTWPEIDFGDLVSDETGGNTKTLQSDYLPVGKYPIVDQGQSLIGGYTNDATRVCKAELPVVIFGDHTKCFKFIDFPFCLGADGTKVLRPKRPVDERYLYYALQRIHIPDAGYSRHFKYLKEGKIPLPTLDEQKRIAAILDHADELRRKRQRALDRLNQLSQAVFNEMFGSTASQKIAAPIVPLGTVCKVSSGSTPSRSVSENYNGCIPWVKTGEVNGKRIKNTSEHISEMAMRSSRLKLYPIGTVLLAMYGQGKTRGQVGILDIPATTNQACAAIVCSDKIYPDFLFLQLKMKYQEIREMGRGGNQPNLNAGMVNDISIILPPIDDQSKLLDFLKIENNIHSRQSVQIDKFEALLSSLENRAFRGDL